MINPFNSHINSRNEYKNINSPKKDLNNSCNSYLNSSRDVLHFGDHFEKGENSFQNNDLYCLHKKKYNEKILKDRKTDAIFTVNQKEILDKENNQNKKLGDKLVNEIDKTKNISNNLLKDPEAKYELSKSSHEKKMEELNLMHVKMFEEMSNNILNKKRNRTNELVNVKPNHDKIMKKIRIIILNNIIIFINKIIKIIYNNDINKSILIKQFLQINKTKLYHSTIEFDKKFMHTKLKEILSEKISTKYSNYPANKNKLLVEDLINSEIGGPYFKKLFELAFLDCIEHIRGTKNFIELNGLMKMDEMLNYEEFRIDKNDIDDFKSYILLYEKIINGKKSRTSKKLKGK